MVFGIKKIKIKKNFNNKNLFWLKKNMFFFSFDKCVVNHPVFICSFSFPRKEIIMWAGPLSVLY